MATFEQIRDKTMEDARKQGLDEMEAVKLLRSRLRRAGIPFPSGMATDEEFKQQQRETEEFLRNKRNKKREGGMSNGGMANGKPHMYLSKGAFVTENLNPGLKALAKKRPDVVKKILKKA